MAMAMATRVCSLSASWWVGSCESQLGRFYNSFVRSDNSNGRSSNKHLLLESKKWKGEREGQGGRERKKWQRIRRVDALLPPICPLKPVQPLWPTGPTILSKKTARHGWSYPWIAVELSTTTLMCLCLSSHPKPMLCQELQGVKHDATIHQYIIFDPGQTLPLERRLHPELQGAKQSNNAPQHYF